MALSFLQYFYKINFVCPSKTRFAFISILTPKNYLIIIDLLILLHIDIHVLRTNQEDSILTLFFLMLHVIL